jgi:uncharacterized protein (DUF2225 family)
MPETLLYCSVCKNTFKAKEANFKANEVKETGIDALFGLFESSSPRCPHCDAVGYCGFAAAENVKEAGANG